MPADVGDGDRMLAHRIVRKVWQAMLVQTSEHMTNGQTLLMVAPDDRAEQVAAELIAEWRELSGGNGSRSLGRCEMASDKTKQAFEAHAAKVRKAVRAETDQSAAVKALIAGQAELLRVSFRAEKARQDAEFTEAMEGVDAAEAEALSVVDDIFGK